MIPISEQIQATLASAREEADRTIAGATRDAAGLTALADDADRELTRSRLERLDQMRRQIESDGRQIASAYATMSEAIAVTTLRLATVAREADFSNPPWPGGIGRAVEIRLAETREVTFRIETTGGSGRDASPKRL